MGKIEEEELAQLLRDRQYSITPSIDLAAFIINKGGYVKQPKYGTHCHICHAAVKDCGCGKKSPKSSEGIRSMEEFQRKYFHNVVGKECPYCGTNTKPESSKAVPTFGTQPSNPQEETKNDIAFQQGYAAGVKSQASKLVSLNDTFIDELRLCWSFNKYQEPNHNYHDREDFIKYVLPKFGTPAIPSVEDMLDAYMSVCKNLDKKLLECLRNQVKENIEAIHRFLSKGDK